MFPIIWYDLSKEMPCLRCPPVARRPTAVSCSCLTARNVQHVSRACRAGRQAGKGNCIIWPLRGCLAEPFTLLLSSVTSSEDPDPTCLVHERERERGKTAACLPACHSMPRPDCSISRRSFVSRVVANQREEEQFRRLPHPPVRPSPHRPIIHPMLPLIVRRPRISGA